RPLACGNTKGTAYPGGSGARRSGPGAERDATPLSASWRAVAVSARAARPGACLADDMGMGKTIQLLALLLVLRQQSNGARAPSLLVAPASLLANWASELERFAPSLKAVI